MTNEERQALIDYCNTRIAECATYAKARKVMEIALAALTAEPAKQPESEDYRNLKELYHAQEKRLFKLAQSIKGPAFDKYSHTTSQAIDVLESALTAEPVKLPCVEKWRSFDAVRAQSAYRVLVKEALKAAGVEVQGE